MASDTKKDFFLSIDKHALAELPAAKFDGKITIVDSAEQVDEAIGCLRESDIIGFDTETRPTFRKGALNEVALMQLSSRETCFLIRLNIIGLPRPVIELLEDDRCTKVGVSIHDDFHNLHRLAAFGAERIHRPSAFRQRLRHCRQFPFTHICHTFRATYIKRATAHQLGSGNPDPCPTGLCIARCNGVHTHLRQIVVRLFRPLTVRIHKSQRP